jgi:hypothetical protein
LLQEKQRRNFKKSPLFFPLDPQAVDKVPPNCYNENRKNKGDVKMKRLTCAFLLLALLMTGFVCCTPDDPAEEGISEDQKEISIERLREGMALSREEAEGLLVLLAEFDLTGEVEFVYSAEDEIERIYYHLWIGEGTADVYLDESGELCAIRQAGKVLWGELPPPPEQEDEGDEPGDVPVIMPEEPLPTTITVDSHTAVVELGGQGYVRAKGKPGVEYKIRVYYSSGASTAKALSPKTAAEDGTLVWEWEISTNVKSGKYRSIIVRADNDLDSVQLPFEVVASIGQ